MKNLNGLMEDFVLSCRTFREATERSFQELRVEDDHQVTALLEERQGLIDRIVPLMGEIAALLEESPVGPSEREAIRTAIEASVFKALDADSRCLDLARGRLDGLGESLRILREGSRARSGYTAEASLSRSVRFRQDA